MTFEWTWVALATLILHETADEADFDPRRFEPDARSQLVWADYDGDGHLDVLRLDSLAGDRLWRGLGDGRFEDRTPTAFPCGSCGSVSADWVDFDGDHAPDLFLLAAGGDARLLRNDGAGGFEDVSRESGLPLAGTIVDAEWFDFDADGRVDLQLGLVATDLLFRNAGAGAFERVDLGWREPERLTSFAARTPNTEERGHGDLVPETRGARRGPDGVVRGPLAGSGGSGPPQQAVSLSPTLPGLVPFPVRCTRGVRDQATASDCLQASSDPTLGRLYPITEELFVSADGDVGLGTTDPGARLQIGHKESGDVPTEGLVVHASDGGVLMQILDPSGVSDPNLAQSLVSTLIRPTLEVGDRNQVRLGFHPNGSTLGFYSSIESVVEDPASGTKSSALRFSTWPSSRGPEVERLRITSSGRVGVGTSSPGEQLSVAGVIETTAGGVKFPDGSVQTTAAGSLAASGYDSGWFSVSTNQNTVLTHSLGSTALIGSIWFSKSSDGTSRCYGPMPLSWREHNPQRTSGVCIAEMSGTTVTVRTGNDFRIPSSSPGPDAHETLTSGWVRVVLLAVD